MISTMKRTIYSIITLISMSYFSSCIYYGYVITHKDIYKNEDSIYINFQERAKAIKTNLGFIEGFETCNLKFEKIYDSKIDTLKHIKLYISTELVSNKSLDNPIFFNIDNNIYKYNYEKINNTYYTITEEEKVDSTTTRTIEKNLKRIRNSIKLSPIILDEINNANSLNIRIYLDEIPYDIKFDFSKLNNLKKFIKREPITNI